MSGVAEVAVVRFDGAQLSVEVYSPVFRVVRMAGVLDAVTVCRLAALVEAQVERARCGGDLVVDLGEISFFGTGDLDALLRAKDTGLELGVRVYVAGLSAREPLLPVRITGALARFPMFPTVEQAERELLRTSMPDLPAGMTSGLVPDGGPNAGVTTVGV